MIPNKEVTPEVLMEWRKDHSMSRAALARVLKYNPSTLYRWERGKQSPPPCLYLALLSIQYFDLGKRLKRRRGGRR